jgi:surface polysaccharide O-acyltransferase-like enzyme
MRSEETVECGMVGVEGNSIFCTSVQSRISPIQNWSPIQSVPYMMSGQLLAQMHRMASTGNFSSTMFHYIEAALIFLISLHGKCTYTNNSGHQKDNKCIKE